jgi:hypothetical protein
MDIFKKIKNYSVCGIVVAINVSSMYTLPVAVEGIDENIVVYNKGRIGKQLQVNQKQRFVFKMAMAGVVLAVCYKLYHYNSGIVGKDVQVVKALPVNLAEGLSTEHRLGLLQEKLDTILRHAQNIPERAVAESVPQTGFYGAAKNISEWLLSQASLIILVNTIGGLMGPLVKYLDKIDVAIEKGVLKVFYTPNVAWFVTTQTKFSMMIKYLCLQGAQVEGRVQEASIYAQEIDKEGLFLDAIKSEQFQGRLRLTMPSGNQIADAWILLLDQIHAVLAFMDYKIERATVQEAKIMRKIADSIRASTNQTAETIARYCSGNQDMIFNQLESYKLELEYACIEFATLERAL